MLYYFYSTSYPNKNSHLLNQMLSICDKLFVSGHEPRDNIILRMKKPVTFIGGVDTCYNVDEVTALFYHIPNWNDAQELVSEFYSFDNRSLELTKRDMTFFFPINND